MSDIRVGVVGVGYLGKFHAEKYAAMDDVCLAGIVDIDLQRAEDVAARFGSRAYADYRDLIGRVDAVSVVVPTESHFSVGLEFLKHGVDVLIEKPMTTTLEQADRLIDVAESQNLILQVGHLERFNPAVLALKDIIAHPMFIEAHRLSIFKDRSTDVSVVLDLMIHDIDIILNIVNCGIQNIQAAGVPVICEHADIANVRLQFESGCVANVTASRISTKNQRKIRIFQKDTYVAVDFAKREITLIRRDGKQSDSLVPGTDFQQLSFSEADVLEDELISFIQAVRTRTTPAVSGPAGRKALAVALEIMDQVEKAIKRYL
ncbi:Oxidoreductase, Gfo/Idh/MocA family [Olavius algarvensis Delta 1 endosymbiont]|nr:Oxidoreductase, Gfo/Idh/MocA family [Olavius algarvensis Delta 1 endosymbiont]